MNDTSSPVEKPHERIADVKRKAEQGPAILQASFRPFFLGAGVWAAFAIPFWLLSFYGILELPDGFDALIWHQHEMLFGFAGAAIAGFILTAIPNWTGRLPVSGSRLALLVCFWLAGRAGFLFSVQIGATATAVLDLSFLTILCVMIARELVAGKNWRNLPVLLLIGLFTCGNWLVHFELAGMAETAELGIRLSTFILAILVALIGGRIVPSFTRNWLVKSGAVDLPEPMGTFDKVALATLVLFVFVYVSFPDHPIAHWLALISGVLHLIRLSRWKGMSVTAEPLMWVLHLGYGWLGVALVLIGLADLTESVPQSAATHALTTGAFGTMILAVMTRASLGHTGRALEATPGTTSIFLLITVAAWLRVVLPFVGDYGGASIWVSGVAWTLAFAIFSILYFPVFTQPRQQQRLPSQTNS